MSSARTISVYALIDHLGGGGAELLLTQFARVAPAAGIELSVTALHPLIDAPAAERLREAGMEPSSIDILPRLTPAVFREVRRDIRRAQPDLVHTHLGLADMVGGVSARSLSLPAVSTLHSTDWSGTSRQRLKERLSGLSRRWCDAHVIAVSDSAKAAYLREGWDRPERITVVRNGVTAAPRPGAGRAVRAELGLDPDAPVIGMLSALRPEKNHLVALAALERLRMTLPDIRLVIVGWGRTEDELKRASAPLGDSVVMTGHRDDVMELLDAFDVLAHPSLAEALPTTLLEAMAAGLPVVASRVGGIPEVVVDGESGVLIEAPPSAEALADALGRLLDDPALRERLATAGRERQEREFGADRWARETRAVYDRLLR